MPGRNFIGVHLEIGLFACSLGVDWALVRGSSISLVLVVRPFCRILLCERREDLCASLGECSPCRIVLFSGSSKAEACDGVISRDGP